MSMRIGQQREIEQKRVVVTTPPISNKNDAIAMIKQANVGENTDVLDINSDNKTQKPATSSKNENPGAVKQLIYNLCMQCGIDYVKLMKNLFTVLNIEISDFENESNFSKEEQAWLLEQVRKSVSLYSIEKRNGALGKDVKPEKFIIHHVIDRIETGGINKKCEESGIDRKKVFESLREIISKEQFDKLTPFEKAQLAAIVNQSINRYIEIKKSGELSEEVDVNKFVIQDVKLFLEAKINGNWITKDEIDAKVEDFKNFSGEDFKKLSPKERDEKFKQYRAKTDAEFKVYLEENLAQVPESQREEEKRKLMARRDALESILIHRLFATMDKEGIQSIGHIAHGKNVARLPEEFAIRNDAQQIADATVFNWLMDFVATNAEAGEPLEANVVQEYNKGLVALKSAEKKTEYFYEYVTLRNSGNIPEYMTEDLFTATAAGIESGVQISENMSAEAKAAFIAQFEATEKQFGDLEIVNQKAAEAVKQYVTENPEKSGVVYTRETKYSQKSSSNTINTPSKEAVVHSSTDEIPYAELRRARDGKTNGYTTNPVVQNAVSNGALIAAEISKNIITVSEAVKQHGLAKVITALKNSKNLESHVEQLRGYIKNSNEQDLMEAYNSSTALFIDEYARPEVARKLFDKKQSYLSFDVRHAIEVRHSKGSKINGNN